MDEKTARETIKKLRLLGKQDRYDESLDLLSELEKTTDLPPNLLVIRGIDIQLSERTDYSLDDAKKAFKKALSIDDRYVKALLQLGWFYYAMEDDSSKAQPLFKKALDISRSELVEAIQGMAECLLETTGKQEALKFLDSAADDKFIKEETADLRQEIERQKEPIQ